MFVCARTLVIALFAVAGPLAAADEPDPTGKPKDYKLGAGKAAVWYDADGWHFRATAGKDGQSFIGRIDAVGGEFVSMGMVSATAGKKEPGLPPMKIKSKGFDVKLNLRKGSESGFDLKLDEAATGIKFTLKIDNKDAPELILVGAKGAHPSAGTFEYPARPGKK